MQRMKMLKKFLVTRNTRIGKGREDVGKIQRPDFAYIVNIHRQEAEDQGPPPPLFPAAGLNLGWDRSFKCILHFLALIDKRKA